MNFPSSFNQFNIPSGARVSTPAGPGTLDGVANTLKRGSTEIESVDALVFVDGIGRKVFDVRQIAREVSQQPVYEGTTYHKDYRGSM